jgi:hypothetical protein
MMPGEIEFESVVGYMASPRMLTPAGFTGFLVTFRVRGISAAAVVLDGVQMRWLLWWEEACNRSTEDSLSIASIDSIGLIIAHWLGPEASLRHGPGRCDSVLSDLSFYPVIPPRELEPTLLWERAQRHAKPKLKNLGDDFAVVPDIISGPQIIAAAPLVPLENQEPFLVQRRLAAADRREWPGFPLTKNTIQFLSPGEYIWAAGPYGQTRAFGVERESGVDTAYDDFGPSVLFFGRPVRGAGLMTVVDEVGNRRVSTANAFPWEYGLSLFSRESLATASRSGEELFPRIGHLIDVLPGPREGEPWPAVRTLPNDAPWGRWRSALPLRYPASNESLDPVPTDAP